jgi:hypothetical protein
MKAIRFAYLAFVFILLLPACTPTPTVEPTSIFTPLPATPSQPVDFPTSVITTPLPVSTRTPRPPTPVPGLAHLPEEVGSNACPNTQPSLLMPGRQGRVSNDTPDPNRVRAEPNAQAALLGDIPAGAYFDVLEGPQCTDDGAWFKIRYDTLEGWMKEGTPAAYWVMPITTDARILTGPSIDAAGFTLTLPVELGTTAQVQDVPFNTAENIPPVTLLRLPEYPLYNGSPSIYIYPVQDYLYYRADLQPRLEGIRSAINTLLADPEAQVGLPEFRDAFLAGQTYLLQAGRFRFGWGLRAVTVADDGDNTPTYVFLGFRSDMGYLFYMKLPVHLAFGELAANVRPDDFSPSITQIDWLLQFQPISSLPTLTDPSLAGACPGAPPFILTLGDWARVSIDPPLPSSIRSNPGSGGDVIGEAQPGDNLLVIDGPQCANGYTWWKVRSLDGLEGWAVEGDSDAYWLVEPISPWYQLPSPLSAGNMQRYDLREIFISAASSLVNDISGGYSALATPVPFPENGETPWPEDTCASMFSSTFCAAHSTYGINSDVLTYSWMHVYDLQDPLSRYYINDQSYDDCTEALRQNLQNDPPVAAYIDPFCGLGGGIPIHFIADVQLIQFDGGRGLRFLIASGNYQTVNTINYRFEGLSDDGRYYITALLREVYHPYIADWQMLELDNFGPFIASREGQYAEAEASHRVFNQRIETLLNAHLVTLYPQLSILDEMMASIEIK